MTMQKIENKLFELWKKIEKNSFVTIKEFRELEEELSKTFIKIQRQRERLEQSRDYWKNKYKEIKNAKRKNNKK